MQFNALSPNFDDSDVAFRREQVRHYPYARSSHPHSEFSDDYNHFEDCKVLARGMNELYLLFIRE